jgi:hypothetical protein
MNVQGIFIGIITFLIIGAFHPVVIKCEYYFGKKVWPAFLLAGILGIVLSLVIKSLIFSCIAGVFGFSSLWAIHEIIEQEERVKKGWFPKNPKKQEATSNKTEVS